METNQNRKERALALTAALTLEEKIGMIHGAELFQTKGVERLNIPPLKMSDGPMGVRNDFEPSNWKTIGLSDDYVTYLPCNAALASTWNRDLVKATGSVLGEEARGRGKDVILAPGINIKRSPLCGRNFEYMSEDPYLSGQLAIAYIEGVQQWDVAACVKHFAVNNQETQRLWVEVEVDETTLREIYLPAFYDAICVAGSHSIMGAYNKLYGEHCCQSQFLLNKILREEWGYDGVTISDWGAVHDTKLAAESSLDIEMSVTYDFDDYFLANPLLEMVKKGEIKEECIDQKVYHILLLMLNLHMIDSTDRKAGSYNTPEHRTVALEAARESVVLLKNEKQQLPLDQTTIRSLLVIGDNAECIHSNGGGSAEIKALYEISPLMGIKTLLGGNTKVLFARGYERDAKEEEEINWQESSLNNGGGILMHDEHLHQKQQEVIEKRQALKEEALELAADVDAVIFIGGLNHDADSEGLDRADMKLPYGQDQLIKELLMIRPDAVITMVAGSPVEMEEWVHQADSLVWSWYAGMEGGKALAEVIFGEINPSGKLPETFYRNHLECSAHILGNFPGEEELEYKRVSYKEGVFVGYRYQDTFEAPVTFPFGHGLSYTKFAYLNTINIKEGELEGMVEVTFSLKNIGTRTGKETVQLYLAQESKEAARLANKPYQELKAFEKFVVEAGKTIVAKLAVKKEDLKKAKEIRIGSSSREILLTFPL